MLFVPDMFQRGAMRRREFLSGQPLVKRGPVIFEERDSAPDAMQRIKPPRLAAFWRTEIRASGVTHYSAFVVIG